MSATDGLLGSTEATGLVADDLRTLERLARAANEPSPKYLVTMKIDRPNDTDAMAAFNRWKDLVLACTPERILSMVERLNEAESELQRIDGLLARRSAIDDLPTRYEKVSHALTMLRVVNAPAKPAARAVPSSLEGRAMSEQQDQQQ